MNQSGDKIFPGAAFTKDQHVAIAFAQLLKAPIEESYTGRAAGKRFELREKLPADQVGEDLTIFAFVLLVPNRPVAKLTGQLDAEVGMNLGAVEQHRIESVLFQLQGLH